MTPDALQHAIAAGSLAARLAGPLKKEVERRTQLTLDRLLIAYRNHTLTGKDAMLAVAELAGLRALLVDLETQARQGQEAETHLR